ncbi:hypothetical protein AUG19_03145 [archaeon 13_1_20CM_2_54_9]|nr:MAG: hypothetical protein AUG19_03145 [archaeon 13_1_20CM_2_54_9]
MPKMERIPINTRVCDLCDDGVTDEKHIVTKSFVLTDWGVICVECWDKRLVHPEEFLVMMVYIKALKIDDKWIRCPLVFINLEERRH